MSPTPHRILLEHPLSDDRDRPQKAESDDGPNKRIECIDSTGQEGEPESEDQPAQRELIGDDVETCVGEGDSEEDRKEEGAPQRLERESRVAEHARPYEPRRQLDEGVLQGDRLTACPATPAQQHVAQYGNVVIPTDWLLRISDSGSRGTPRIRLLASGAYRRSRKNRSSIRPSRPEQRRSRRPRRRRSKRYTPTGNQTMKHRSADYEARVSQLSRKQAIKED